MEIKRDRYLKKIIFFRPFSNNINSQKRELPFLIGLDGMKGISIPPLVSFISQEHSCYPSHSRICLSVLRIICFGYS